MPLKNKQTKKTIEDAAGKQIKASKTLNTDQQLKLINLQINLHQRKIYSCVVTQNDAFEEQIN